MSRAVGIVVAAVLCALPAIAQPTLTQSPSTLVAKGTGTPETLALAKSLIEADGSRARSTSMVSSLTGIISRGMTSILSLDQMKSATVNLVIQNAMNPQVDWLMDERVKIYAANFSVQELRDLLIYTNSATGRADAAKIPLLDDMMHDAITGSMESTANAARSANDAFSQVSPATRDLVHRIMLSQDAEGLARRSFLARDRAVAAIRARNGLAPSQPPSERATQKRADDYVEMVVSLERGYYVINFSDEQLADIAAFLDTPTGKAMSARHPGIMNQLQKDYILQLSAAMATLSAKICEAVSCTPQQRTTLDAGFEMLHKNLPVANSFIG